MSFHAKLSEQIAEDYSDIEDNKKIWEITRKYFRGKVVLDAGCGKGNFSRILSSGEFNVVGVDICKNLLMSSKSSDRSNRFNPVLCDLERMPFKDECFDMCACIFVLHHFPDISDVSKEFSRILKDEGGILLVDTNGSNPYIKLSRNLGKRIGPLLERIGRASRNEGSHTHSMYIENLKEAGFNNIHFKSQHLNKELQRLRVRNLREVSIYTVAAFERAVFNMTWKLLPQPLGGHSLIIHSIKRPDDYTTKKS